MNKNFGLLKDYFIFDDESQKDIFNKIEQLYEMVEQEELKYFGFDLRKTLELIFDSCDYINSEGFLSKKINNLKNKYSIPANVLNGLYSLKNIGNRESHSTSQRKSEEDYKIDISSEECFICFRNLWLFLKWIAVDVKGIEELKNEVFIDTKKSSFISESVPKGFENMNNDMEAKKITISQLIFSKDFVFNIPTYQRDYTWDKVNIMKLLNDITKRAEDNKTHYFGSLAIAIEDEKKILRIIDGQQRITTSLILLKAIHNAFLKRTLRIPDELIEFIEDKMASIYINQDVLLSQRSVRMLLGGGVYESSLSKLPFENYQIMEDYLEKINDDDLFAFYSTFVTKFETAILIFSTSIDNEIDVFENLNTGGTKLSSWDLIRSYIFSRIKPNKFREREKEIDRLLLNTIVIPLNNVTNNKSSKMINNFFTIYTRYLKSTIKSKVYSGEAYDGFKEVWPLEENRKFKFSSISSFQKSIFEIEKIFYCFMEIKYYHKQNTSKLHSYSHIISLINRDDFMPLLIHSMLIYCTFENKLVKKISNEFIKIIRILETIFMRGNLYGNNQKSLVDKYLTKNPKEIHENLFKYLKEESSLIIMTIDEFKDQLSNSGSWETQQITNLVTHLEIILRRIPSNKSGYIRFEKTHEHIIAQKLPYENYDDKSISEEEFNTLRDSRKNYIGNALLLSLGDNSKAGNKKFIEKLDIYKWSYLAKGCNDKDLKIMNLLEKKVFTFKDVKKRSEEIANFVFSKKIYYDE